MSIVLQIILILLSIGFNLLVLNMVRVGRVELRYALAWLVVGLVLLVLSIWPGLLDRLALAMNVTVPINAAFFLAIVFLMSFLVGVTIVISDHKTKLYRLTQLAAIQEKRIRELEEKLAALQTADGDGLKRGTSDQ